MLEKQDLQNQPLYSVIVPVYNSSKILPNLLNRLENVFSELEGDVEYIMVNDGSRDNSWEVLLTLHMQYSRLVAINLMQNFGQHNAIMCGASYARGSYIITMDDDLQHPPEEIPKLIDKLKDTEVDVVYARFEKKQHHFIRNLGSKLITRLTRITVSLPENLYISSFRGINRQTIEHLLAQHIPSPRIDILLCRITNRIVNVDTEHHPRKEGVSTYKLVSLLSMAFGNIFNFTSLPLRVVSGLGFFASFGGFLLALYYLMVYLLGNPVSGYTSIVLLILIFSGLILLTLGIVGEYLIRIIRLCEKKPVFMIREIKKNRPSEEGRN